ncbi:retrovirus-related Pol polyprotein from transposon opus [Trichonephila clavipes]|nr:retrovirus-related Pol polyprotein from transposon opus [Trichonephila clavipes]
MNKMRKYHPRALAVGVIFEGDHEFGEIHPSPNLSRSTSERVLHEINLNHLKESEREQVLAIVLKHQTLFTSDVKIAKVGTHRIRLKPNIEQSLKIKVDEQIEELLRLDLIEESDAEIAYPIVCVNKKDGTLRLCVDFRALNLESVSDDFFRWKMQWSSYILLEEPISSQHPEKTAVINNLPVPKTKKELRSVLGLCNYYREYIPKYSELVYPLTELTKKRVPDSIPWTEKHDSSFHLLKKALVEAPSLYSPVPDKPYTIHSDASKIGIAACLSQKCGDKCYPIAYASQKLSKTQQSWSTIEREAFAIVWNLKKFEVWVFGTEIEFYTDHNPLPYLTKSAPQSAKLQRWAFALQRFNVTINHCPGVKMPHADALSRLV